MYAFDVYLLTCLDRAIRQTNKYNRSPILPGNTYVKMTCMKSLNFVELKMEYYRMPTLVPTLEFEFLSLYDGSTGLNWRVTLQLFSVMNFALLMFQIVHRT